MFQFRPRQFEMALALQHEILVEHDVHIERAAGEPRHIAAATVAVFECVQPVVERGRRQVGVDRGGEIEEVRAFETDRLAAVNRRNEDVAEAATQFGKRGAQMFFRFEIRTEAQIGATHVAGLLPRSIATPTDLDPRTAPGLASLRRSHETLNSPSTISAQRSARVSTSSKWAPSTNAIRRLETAL